MKVENRPRGRLGKVVVGLGALALLGLNLRLALAAISPLTGEILEDYDLTTSGAGLAMTVAVLMFGVFAPLTPRWIARYGVDRVLTLGLGLIIVGVLVRSVPGAPFLYLGMLVLGAGIALMNVVLPVVVKRDFAAHASFATGLYTAALNTGSAVAAAGVVPLSLLLGGWRPAVAMAVVPAVIALVAWWYLGSRKKAVVTERVKFRTLVRDPVALQVTAYMLLQSLLYYALLAWLPTIYSDNGLTVVDSGLLLAAAQMAQLVACVLVPFLVRRRQDQRLAAAGFALVTGFAFVGLAVAPVATPLLWAILLGLGQGGALTISLLLIVMRSSSPAVAAGLSGMAQGIGYAFAAIGPVAVGALHDWMGEWTIALLLLSILCAVEVWVGILAGRNKLVFASTAEVAVELEGTR